MLIINMTVINSCHSRHQLS